MSSAIITGTNEGSDCGLDIECTRTRLGTEGNSAINGHASLKTTLADGLGKLALQKQTARQMALPTQQVPHLQTLVFHPKEFNLTPGIG